VAFIPMAQTAFRNLFTKPATRRYPFVVRPAFPTSRGRILNDFPKCILCSLCAKHCPADAIVVDKAQGLWRIDRFACVICGACVRACPVKCLSMGNERPRAVDFADTAGRSHEHRREPSAAASPAAGTAAPGAALPGSKPPEGGESGAGA